MTWLSLRRQCKEVPSSVVKHTALTQKISIATAVDGVKVGRSSRLEHPPPQTTMEGVLDGPGSGPGKGKKGCNGDEFVEPGEKDTQVQLVISMVLGLTAFMAFCVSKTATPRVLECMHADPSDPVPCRHCAHDGKTYMPRGGDSSNPRQSNYLLCPTPSLGGCPPCTGSQKIKCWKLPGLMPTW